MKTTPIKEKESTAKSKAVDSSEKILKKKALEVTFSQIDKQYGNGAVMLLGKLPIPVLKLFQLVQCSLTMLLALADFPLDVLLKFLDLKLQVKPLWQCMRSLKRKKTVAFVPLLMRSMLGSVICN